MPTPTSALINSPFKTQLIKTTNMQMTPPLWQKAKRNWRTSWWKWKRRVKKLAWNSAFKKLKSWFQVPSLHGKIDGETAETVADFIFFGSKITAVGDCSHEIKRCLPLGRKTMTNLDSILNSRDITLLTKVCLVKAMFFPGVTYGCESWTVKKVEHWRTDAFELWCWRRLLRVL